MRTSKAVLKDVRHVLANDVTLLQQSLRDDRLPDEGLITALALAKGHRKTANVPQLNATHADELSRKKIFCLCF